MRERSRLRDVVVPTEHGGWGFTLEPVLLGLLVARGWASPALGLSALAVFVARRPLRLWVIDTRRGQSLKRTGVARRSVVALGTVALGGLTAATLLGAARLWWPLLAAAPLAAFQLRYDLRNRQRELAPELVGPLVLAAFAPAMLLAEGSEAGLAAGAWLTLAARIVPSVLVVRVQVRRAKGLPFHVDPVHAAGAAAVTWTVAATAVGWSPWTAIAAAGAVAGWNTFMLARPPLKARTLGWTQMVVGLAVVGLFALGYHLLP